MNNTLGEIKDEILTAVRNLHIAFMGDNRNEITQAQAVYDKMVLVYGQETVALVQKFYNEEIIAKA